jgi:hypothetical protein
MGPRAVSSAPAPHSACRCAREGLGPSAQKVLSAWTPPPLSRGVVFASGGCAASRRDRILSLKPAFAQGLDSVTSQYRPSRPLSRLVPLHRFLEDVHPIPSCRGRAGGGVGVRYLRAYRSSSVCCRASMWRAYPPKSPARAMRSRACWAGVPAAQHGLRDECSTEPSAGRRILAPPFAYSGRADRMPAARPILTVA